MPAKIIGLKELNRRFARIPKQVKKDVEPALEQGAQEIVGMQKSLVPKRTLALYNSIRWEWDRKVEMRINIGAGERGGTAYYARFVEFGTVFNRSQPFFFPAYRSLRTRVRRRIQRAVRNAVKKTATAAPQNTP